MAKATHKTRTPRARRTRAPRRSARAGAFERQVVRVASTLGRLVGQAESRWEVRKDQRQHVASAIDTVRQRATSVLSSLGSEVRTMAGRAAGRRAKPVKRSTPIKRAAAKRPTKKAATRAAKR